MPITTKSASNVDPLVHVIVKPLPVFAIPLTSCPKRTFVLSRWMPSFHASRIASRVPALNASGERRGSTPGSSITCLPFWYR
jgi:hypothetical protein